MAGTLYLVATPIGNQEDITFRALRVLREADVVVIEERRAGMRFLAQHNIVPQHTDLLNEHTEQEATEPIIHQLAAGKNVALISDGGTPLFSDPGHLLVARAIKEGIAVVPIPGASSLVAALVVSGFGLNSFMYYGWLSPKRDERIKELKRLRSEARPVILLDTPYRLAAVLQDLAHVFGATRRVVVGFNLTMPDEQIFRGSAEEIHRIVAERGLKGEYVIIIEPIRRGVREKAGRPEKKCERAE